MFATPPHGTLPVPCHEAHQRGGSGDPPRKFACSVLYDPYGKVTVCDGSWTPREGNASAYSNEVLFTGHRLNPESGLYTTLYRPYHPTLGDWTGRDPKGYVDGMGLYEYVGGCPLSRLDAMTLAILRRHGRTGRPWADPRFVARVERQLSRRLAPRRPGRPRKGQ
jgi:RHS repeat-associated protein